MGTTGTRHGIGMILYIVIETIFHYIVMRQTLCQKYGCWRYHNGPSTSNAQPASLGPPSARRKTTINVVSLVGQWWFVLYTYWEASNIGH